MDKGDAKNGAPSAPNASMDLLARIVEGSLDPSYRKHHEQAGPKEKWWLRTGIFLASIALAFATIIAVSDMVSTKDEVPEAMERLTSQIEQKQIAVDELEVLTAQLEDRLAQAE